MYVRAHERTLSYNQCEQPVTTDLLSYQFFIDWCTKETAVAFLKFFISHELESTMWHTKQSGDVTLVNKIQSICSWHFPSRFNNSTVICTICTELHLRYSKSWKNQALVAQIYNAIYQAPVFFHIVDNIITRCLPLRKVNGKRLFASLYWKISGSNRRSEKVVLFFSDGIFQTEIRVTFVTYLWYQLQVNRTGLYK